MGVGALYAAWYDLKTDILINKYSAITQLDKKDLEDVRRFIAIEHSIEMTNVRIEAMQTHVSSLWSRSQQQHEEMMHSVNQNYIRKEE